MKNYNKINNFDSVSIKVASPEKILEWSHGEVTRPETLNYRTGKSERNGLFDEKIFGPEKDYECYCGKYKGVRYKGIVCEKCGVELTRSVVRRERMGHIELASPVSHIWFLRSMPSRLGLILGMSSGDLEKVIYFAGYIITKVFDDEKKRVLKDLDSEFKSKVKSASDEKTKDALKEKLMEAKKEIEQIEPGTVLDELSYHNFSMKYSTLFEAGIGAEAIYDICKNLNLEKLMKSLVEQTANASPIVKQKLNKRISVIRGMIKANLRPEWLFITEIPVIPPGIRPMVALDGGRFASSDVNDLYRRIINRNNRLKKLINIMAPEVILRNEKRILQEAVDALLDSSIRHTTASAGAMNASQRRELKSLADNLKGKKGIFRQNLLGKRVDYSGRSVIVVGPDLALDQCGLPKHMALELFRPFIISELIHRELAYNIRGANRLIEERIPEVWAILEEVIMDKYVLLNRAPTLHRLSIQAFRPVLIEGNAIQIHPLVCTAFNADFDGDQMAVHVPLGEEAQLEAKEIMSSNKNLLKPGSGNFVVSIDKLDIILGCYWITKIMDGKKGEGKVFGSPADAILASDFNEVDLRARIKVSVSNSVKFPNIKGTELIETSVGRLLFDEIMPADYPFINKELSRKAMGPIIDDLMNRYGMEALPDILDKIKKFGFKFAACSGTTWGLDDVKIPKEKDEIISEAKKQTLEIQAQFDEGLLSEDERYRKNIAIWHDAKNKVEKTIPQSLEKDGSVYDLVYSGARGSFSQLTQMTGMKGLIQNTAGDTLEFPIIASNKEGFSPVEYFITTHGSRKGLADTALNTAKAGYLTRKLFVVAQDIIVNQIDCGTKDGIYISKISASGIETSFSKSLKGRVLAETIYDQNNTEVFKAGSLLSTQDAKKIEELGLEIVKVRSPLTCKLKQGICATCYGADLGSGKLVGLGEAVGTIAAQAIGEPGTQLTMRTFHAGGTASVGGDITQGLPRVEELFEKRSPKNPAIIAKHDCTILEVKEEDGEKIIITLAENPSKKAKSAETEYRFPINRSVLVKKGDSVKKGDLITDGSADLDTLFKYAGKEKTLDYIVHEVSKPYELQGESVSRKHIEVIIRQMFSRKKITEPGDTRLSKGDIIDQQTLEEANEEARLQQGEPAKSENLILGISEVSLSRRSFLAAASFQFTTRILVGSAIKGAVDPLNGLMENVIVGRLIPAGTGFQDGPKGKMITDLQQKMRQVDEEAKMALEVEGDAELIKKDTA